MIRIAVVEDEPVHQKTLTGYIDRYFSGKDEVKLSVFSDGTDFLAACPPGLDILFLDIVMKQSNGLEVAREVRARDERVLIIFVTEMFQYALEGYRVNALDFLVKPLYYTAFCASMKRALGVLKKQMPALVELNYDKMTSYLDVSTIYYIETDSKKTLFHTQNGDYFSSDTMRTLEEKLEKHGVLRCHQAYLVNVRHIESVHRQEVLVHGVSVPISRQKKEDFLQKFVKSVGGCL